jgi:hypothetical protein
MVDLDLKTCLAVPGAIWATIQILGKGKEWRKDHPKIYRWGWIVAWVSIVAGIIFESAST